MALYRYVKWLKVFLTNIEKSHPGVKDLLMKGGIAITRSLIPVALSAVDKMMEETFMKFSKSAVTGILYLLILTTLTRDIQCESLLRMRQSVVTCTMYPDTDL